MGKLIQELCHVHDLPILSAHLTETLNGDVSEMSKMYRLMVSPEKYVHIQTKSKLFKAPEGDFIMATHSIIG